jgi:5-amino-6-(5-phosphoribosylamino)uracil reductase
MDHLRHRVDAILIGAATLRAADYPLQLRDPVAKQLRQARGLPPGIGCVVLTESMQLPLEAKFFRQPLAPFVAVATTDQAPAMPGLEELGIKLWRCGAPHLEWATLFSKLAAQGVRRLLVEAGRHVVTQLFEHDLVDEVYLTLCPVILGGNDGGRGAALQPLRRLNLRSCVPRGDDIFCHYAVERPSPKKG